jgi:serralysin
MSRRLARFALALAATAAGALITSGPAHAEPLTELLPEHGPVVPLKNAAMIVKTGVGYRYMAGQQDSHLTVSQVGNRLVFVDTATAELRKKPKSCVQTKVSKGIQVSCRINPRFTATSPMFLEIWPRLGDDYVDGGTLSSTFRMWVLGDAGAETVYTGAGDDFFNGASGDDVVYGGAGADWLRTGLGNDTLDGQEGDDRLVAVQGNDEIHGGEGDDQVGGGVGDDQLWGDAGNDTVSCGSGWDDAWFDWLDRVQACESAYRS